MEPNKNIGYLKQYPIKPQGSLGLLALGAKGVLAWRAAKNQAQNPQDASK